MFKHILLFNISLLLLSQQANCLSLRATLKSKRETEPNEERINSITHTIPCEDRLCGEWKTTNTSVCTGCNGTISRDVTCQRTEYQDGARYVGGRIVQNPPKKT